MSLFPRFWRVLVGVSALTGLALPLPPGALAAAPQKTIATFSIVAWDPETGDLGVAVQSRFFAVGSVVPWAQAKVGAIASQAFGNTTFGPKGLALLGAGKSPEEVMQALLADDSGRTQRQVGIVNAQGAAQTYTGSGCMTWAGGRIGKYYACQGNILAGPQVVDAMARAYEETPGMLGDRLLAALDAGEAAGGDSRGMQSAALLIVRDKGGYGGFNDRYCDLRVDDAPNPFQELRRLYNIWKPEALIREGYNRCDAGQFDKAFAMGLEALALDGTSGQPEYHLACYHMRAGHRDEALSWIARSVARDAKNGVAARTDSDLAPLRDDPKFIQIVGK